MSLINYENLRSYLLKKILSQFSYKSPIGLMIFFLTNMCDCIFYYKLYFFLCSVCLFFVSYVFVSRIFLGCSCFHLLWLILSCVLILILNLYSLDFLCGIFNLAWDEGAFLFKRMYFLSTYVQHFISCCLLSLLYFL